jgi:membrane protein DedA with SNARE-associated domain
MLQALQSLLSDHGYWVIAVAVFLNNLGFPIPGDMTVLGGGFLAHKGILSFGVVGAIATTACFLGSNIAYWVGLRYGHPFILRIHWLHADPKRLHQFDHFFQHYGAKVVLFARFVALLHPVTGYLAGAGKTPVRSFLFYNLVGSAAYGFLYASAGYFFSQRLGDLQTWLGPLFTYVILTVGVLALLVYWLRRSILRVFGGLIHHKEIEKEPDGHLK